MTNIYTPYILQTPLLSTQTTEPLGPYCHTKEECSEAALIKKTYSQLPQNHLSFSNLTTQNPRRSTRQLSTHFHRIPNPNPTHTKRMHEDKKGISIITLQLHHYTYNSIITLARDTQIGLLLDYVMGMGELLCVVWSVGEVLAKTVRFG